MDHLGLDGCTLIANLWGIVFWILQSGNGNYKGEVGGGGVVGRLLQKKLNLCPGRW